MLIALLLQAAIVAQPPAEQPKPVERRAPRIVIIDRVKPQECGAGLIQAARSRTESSLYDGASPAVPQAPVWKPGEFPDEGYYAAVERRVDGCPVATPISLRNKPADTRD